MTRLFDPAIFDGTALFDSGILIVAVPPIPTLEAALGTHHQPAARLQFLAADLETVLHEVPAKLVNAGVTMDRSRDIHRQGTAELANDDGLYSPTGPGALVWPNNLVRFQRGAYLGGVPEYRSLITGVIGRPKESAQTGVVTFQIWSRLHLADRQFYGPLTIPAGTRVDDAIRAMLELGGLGLTDGFYDLDSGGATTAAARTYDTSERILAAAIKLAFDAGCDLYDTGDGIATLRPWPDPNTLEPVWTFAPGVDSTLAKLDREVNETVGVYNRATATGIGPDRYPITAEAKVTNPNDPLFWTPENDRPRPPYSSSDITTQQMANAVALRLLFEGATYQEELAAVAAENPLIEDRQAVRFVGAGVDDVYLLDKVDHAGGPGTMTMTTRKVRSLLEG